VIRCENFSRAGAISLSPEVLFMKRSSGAMPLMRVDFVMISGVRQTPYQTESAGMRGKVHA